MKQSVIIAFAYIAAVIGAGFASGAEVVSFFLVYGKESIIGLFLAGALFGVFAYLMLKDCIENRIYSFSDYLKFIMSPLWGKITSAIVIIFMTISLAAMAAAAGEILNDAIGLSKFLGVVVFSLVCAVLLKSSVSGITAINGILGVLIAVGIVFGCIYVINFRFLETFNRIGKIATSAVSYVSYNGISAAVILCSMSRLLKTRKQAYITAVLIGVGIFVILAFLWCVVGIYYGKVNLGEIPMLSIAARQGKVFYLIYSIILFLAVFTTAVSNGFGVIEYVKKFTSGVTAVFIVLLMMIFLSGIGFSKIVDVLYRICGYASLILPIFILKNNVKKRKIKKIEEKE